MAYFVHFDTAPKTDGADANRLELVLARRFGGLVGKRCNKIPIQDQERKR